LIGGGMNPSPATATGKIPVGRRRWTIGALLLFATTINDRDRQILGLLAPDL